MNLRFLAEAIGWVGVLFTRMRVKRWLEKLVRELSTSADLDMLSWRCLQDIR